MSTQSNTDTFLFHTDSRQDVALSFTAGHATSDGGALLLGEVERVTGVLRQLTDCFTDHRDPDLIEHSAAHLLAQRIYALALGYEDLNDHDTLRFDPLLALLVGKADLEGDQRLRDRDRGKPLAGKSTLNRLELTPADATASQRYKKIVARPQAIEQLFLDVFVQAHPTAPTQLVLDLDATDDPLHGAQEGRFFHGYYREYCYLPLYLFCGEHLLVAELRTADRSAAAGALAQLQRVIAFLRHVWPTVGILVRGDADFGTDEIMSWCEDQNVDYVFGLAKNSRLLAMLARDMDRAYLGYFGCGVAYRVFAELRYRTLKSWSRERRVVGKAEYLPTGPNPRFVVTSLAAETQPAQTVYEQTYCGRGDMENRLKEQKQDLAAGRTSTAALRSNQLRLWFSSLAYVLVSALRRLGLGGTALAKGQCGTLRQKLLKIGGLVRVTAARVWVSLSSAWPFQDVFAQAYTALRALPTAVEVAPLRC